MNKICTSIEQSKKLIELGIDVNTADMRYGYIAPYEFSDRKYDGGYDMIPYHKDFFDRCSNFSANEYDDELPCWSLTALLELMPKLYDEDNLNDGGCQPVLCKGFDNDMWHVVYRSTMYMTDWYYDPVDAAFDMVCWLLENKKI